MKLRQWMKLNDVTIPKMADRLGISAGSINNLFRGTDPRLSLALLIERETFGNVTCQDLLDTVIEKRGDATDKSKAKKSTKNRRN